MGDWMNAYNTMVRLYLTSAGVLAPTLFDVYETGQLSSLLRGTRKDQYFLIDESADHIGSPGHIDQLVARYSKDENSCSAHQATNSCIPGYKCSTRLDQNLQNASNYLIWSEAIGWGYGSTLWILDTNN